MYAFNMKEYLNLTNLKNRGESQGLIESRAMRDSRNREETIVVDTS